MKREKKTKTKKTVQLKTMKCTVASLEHKINTEYIKDKVSSLL